VRRIGDIGHTCPAEWVHACIKTAGHAGRHKDWTDRTWTDDELRAMRERAVPKALVTLQLPEEKR
jgi:hypothetical protein